MAGDFRPVSSATEDIARGAPRSTSRPSKSNRVSAFPLEDELVLHDASSGAAYVLDRVAAHVWQLCDGSHTTEALASALTAAFAVDHQTALADVHAFVQELHDAGLLSD
jgi:hypothetical protein